MASGRPKNLVFKRGTFLAVRGDNSEIWFCKTVNHVFSNTTNLNIRWLENCQKETYVLNDGLNSIFLESVVRNVRAAKLSRNQFRILNSEIDKVKEIVNLVNSGHSMNLYEEEYSGEPLTKRLKLENDSPSTSVSAKRKLIRSPKERKRKVAKVKEVVQTGKKRKALATSPTKKEKGPKPKVVRTPNWKLKPNPNVAVYEKDPLFEDVENVPVVSSSAHSKLVIRAVLLNDLAMLKKHLTNRKEISNINQYRSMSLLLNAMDYAILKGNTKAIHLIKEEQKQSHKFTRADEPRCLLSTYGTGTYNYRSLGIRYIRRLNMSRGSKEGNNALVKDKAVETDESYESLALNNNIPMTVIKTIISLKCCDESDFVDNVYLAVRRGYRKLASEIMSEKFQRGNEHRFGKYFGEVLMSSQLTSPQPIREVSMKKKAGHENKNFTPIHCAAINPNVSVLEKVLEICPEYNITDADMRKPIHYAASCEGTAPLEFLISRNANLYDTDKEGKTPLMIACEVGRHKNVEVILNNLKEIEASNISSGGVANKYGVGHLDQPLKNSFCPIHFAVSEGHVKCVEILLKFGANINKPLNTNFNKISPLMIAASKSNLEMVKFLFNNHAKVEQFDRHKKTALFHAIINGSASVASYLISVGANPSKPDTSGNTCLHYACAYGWYFCMKLLLDAKVEVDCPNSWKLTPLAVSYMKGHDGLMDILLDLPDVNVDFMDEDGKTLLLHLVSGTDIINKTQFSQLKKFVEYRKASCSVTDKTGKNALHYLCRQTIGSKITAEKDLKKWYIMQQEMVEYVIKHGTPLNVLDHNDLTPFNYLLKFRNKIRDSVTSSRNVNLIKKFIDDIIRTENNISHTKLLLKLLQQWSEAVEMNNIEEDELILNYILEKLPSKCLDAQAVIGYKNASPLMNICKKIAKFNEMGIAESLITKENEHKVFSHSSVSYKWEVANEILCVLLDFNFELEYSWEITVKKDGKDTKKIVSLSALDILLNESNHFNNFLKSATEILLNRKPDVNYVDADGQSILLKLIDRCEVNKIKWILDTKIDVNYVKETKSKDSSTDKKIINKTYSLLEAVMKGDYEIVSMLILNGGDVVNDRILTDGKSLLLTAVHYYLHSRSKSKLKIITALLDAKSDINVKDTLWRNSLHLAMNNSTGNAELSSELEVMLIRRGIDLFAKDKRGRYPLHYVFVKIGKFKNASESDPIETCTTLVDAMQSKGVNELDDFQQSPLHYAAYRGATVCCLYLIKKGAKLNAKDLSGNTPLSFSILGNHSGCCLTLIQKGADISDTVLERETIELSSEKGGKSLVENKNWKYLESHFKAAQTSKPEVIFEAILKRGWLGISYIVLDQLEEFGMPYSKTIEIAMRLQKVFFAKTLINKQSSDQKLFTSVSHGRNLFHALAFEVKNDSHVDVQLEIIDTLNERGLKMFATDKFNCTPLHYACFNHNFELGRSFLKDKKMKEQINTLDANNRSAFLALFWNYYEFNHSLGSFIADMINNGADPNFLCDYRPMSYVKSGFEPYSIDSDYLYCKFAYKTTPLILAIIHQDLKLLQCLLSNSVDPNKADSKGMTPIMHAVKTNDFQIVKTVLSINGNYTPTEENLYALKAPSNINKDIDFNAIDVNGYGVIQHAMMLGTDTSSRCCYARVDILKLILEICSKHAELKFSNSFFDVAKSVGNNKMIKTVLHYYSKHGKNNYNSLNKSDEIQLESHVVNDRIKWKNSEKIDFSGDSEKMLKILEHESEKKDKLLNDADININEIKRHHGCIVKNGSLVYDSALTRDFEVLMTKIDLSYGAWGMYNYYRMQIWHCEDKNMYVLFTNWGRLGDDSGQYQNTPYAKKEEAIEEFSKIFKAKSGNDWSNFNNFQEFPKKYRLVKSEFYKRNIKKKAIQFDFEKSKCKSELHAHLKDFIKDISNVAMLVEEYKTLQMDETLLPFGKLKKDDVLKAKEILLKITEELSLKEKLEKKKDYVELKEYPQCVQNIFDLSSEYHYILPGKNFSYVRVQPIDSDFKMKSEFLKISRLLELAYAEKLLLAAQFNLDKMNPLDLIYRGLECQIELLNEKDDISQFILQYMHNSKSSHKLFVKGIYKIHRSKDTMKETVMKKVGNRKLLWHGTKSRNMIGICREGLKVDPIHSPITGRLYGNGVYMADVFQKSYDYTYDYNSRKADYIYMLICEAALGKCKSVFSADEDTSSYDSCLVTGNQGPNEFKDITIGSGVVIPIGKLVENPYPASSKRRYYRPPYSEYIVDKEDQIAVRYIVQISTKSS